MPNQQSQPTNEPIEPKIDQSRTTLEIAAELNAYALKMRNKKPVSARKSYEKAYDLVRNDTSDRTAMAASLAGLAYLNNDAGDVDIAVSQNFEVISLLINYPPASALVDAYCNLTWVFYSFGDFRGAISYASKALKAAQELKDDYWEARALDTYGFSLFADSLDTNESVKFQEKAAQLYEEIYDYSEQARVYNNIADTHLRGGKPDVALEFSQKSLALAKKVYSPIVEKIAAITMSEVLLTMGEYTQAKNYLLEILSQITGDTPVIFKVYILTSLAQIHLVNSQTDEAESSLLTAIEIAVHTKSIYDQVIAYRILSEVYEKKQDYSKALEQHKKFAYLNEKLLNEKAAKQFYALKVESNLEMIQRDAEINRLKTIELQNEINERSRIQKELETLATTDPLTGLYNRRHFFHLAKHEFEQVCRFKRAIALVLIDLDDFKHINDTFGHPTGDSVLSGIAGIFQDFTRTVDIVCRYGGEEFAILMPETDSAKSEMIIQRVRKALQEQVLMNDLVPVSITFSAGIASFNTNESHVPEDFELLIKQADQSLYEAKNTGKNRTVLYSS